MRELLNLEMLQHYHDNERQSDQWPDHAENPDVDGFIRDLEFGG